MIKGQKLTLPSVALICATVLLLSVIVIPAQASTQNATCLPGYSLNQSTGKCQADAPVFSCSINQQSYTSQSACDSNCIQTAACLDRNHSNKALTGGQGFRCSLHKDKTVWCQGRNEVGQLGNGAQDDSLYPVQVSGLTDVSQVDAGYATVCAVKTDGTVWCWGSNNGYGLLGQGDTEGYILTPVQVPGLTGVAKISVGWYSVHAIKPDGTVWAWGNSRLGDDLPSTLSPVQITTLTNISSISNGGGTVCAVKSDGTVSCWGDNSYGQLGQGNAGGNSSVPVLVPGLTGALSVSTHYLHVCALQSDGKVFCWGRNDYGQNGNNTTDDLYSPTEVFQNASQISTDNFNTCALKSDGTVWCWGANGYLYDLGIGSSVTQWPEPLQVSNLTGITYVDSSGTGSCAIKSDGTSWCWGYNTAGALGNGNTDNQPYAVQTPQYADGSHICPHEGWGACSGDPSSCSLTGVCNYVPESYTCPNGGVLNPVTNVCELDSISISATLAGPESLYAGESATYTVAGASNFGEVGFQITVPDSSPVSGDTATYSPQSGAQGQVVGKVYLVDYPDIYATETMNVTVTAYPTPTVTLTGPVTAIAGDTAQFTITHDETNSVTVEWKLDGAIIEEGATESSADILFDATGTYHVSVTVYPTAHPEVSVTKSKTVAVTEYPAPVISITGPRVLAAGDAAQYAITHNATVPITIEWEVNEEQYQGDTLNVTFTTPGINVVTATAYPVDYPNSKRTATYKVTVSKYPVPMVSMYGPRTLKEQDTGEFSITHDSKLPVAIEWDVNGVQYEGSPVSIKFDKVGYQRVNVAVYPVDFPDSKRTGAMVVKVTSDPDLHYVMPVFTIKSSHKPTGTAPYKVAYRVYAKLAGLVEPFTYTWDMGDGTVLTTQARSINHVYAAGGAYIPTLTVSDTKGNKQTITDSVTVANEPAIVIDSFKVGPSNRAYKVPLTVRLLPKITGGNTRYDKFTAYQWSVNGTPIGDNKRNAVITFNEPGTYEVGLTVTSQYGYTGTGSVTVTAVENQLPTCEITYEDQPQFKRTKFDAACADPDGRISKYIWDMGNGLILKARKPIIRYETGGTYSVTLTAIDDTGGQVTVSQDVVVERN